MNRKNLLWIPVGIGIGVMTSTRSNETFFLFFFGNFILSVVVGIVSKNKYLPFIVVSSSFVTDYMIFSWEYGPDVGTLLFVLLFSGLYSIPGFLAAWVAKRRAKKQKEVAFAKGLYCPNCREKTEKDWNSCPYCGKSLEGTQIYDEDTRVYDAKTRIYE